MNALRIADGLVTVEDGGETFLLHTSSRRYYRLNESGSEIWRALQHHADPRGALIARYPTTPLEVLGRDAEEICAQLLEAGLVERSTT